MDSLTQLTFGAACGEAILGQKVGRKALVWGAVLGTLPDLDVFISLGSPVDDFVYHRGFSHSLFLLAILSPMIAWLISNIHSDTKRYYRRWVLLCFLVLETSVLLDLLTIYGTQIFWPFDTTPMALPVLFIIDPLFTLPVLSGVLAALVLKRNRPLGHRLNFETYFSLFDKDTPLSVDFYPRNLALTTGIEEHPPVVKLKWFTRGYYAFSTLDEDVVMTDLRMGSEPDYVFRFKVARLNDSQPSPIFDERLKTKQDWRRLAWVWKRIWDAMPER